MSDHQDLYRKTLGQRAKNSSATLLRALSDNRWRDWPPSQMTGVPNVVDPDLAGTRLRQANPCPQCGELPYRIQTRISQPTTFACLNGHEWLGP